ncbi:MAG: hypothetical protein KDA81_07405 [Planctomycetaceae bacterium]|nr:hypothetical protein [Planctomycetaceae bacterium]
MFVPWGMPEPPEPGQLLCSRSSWIKNARWWSNGWSCEWSPVRREFSVFGFQAGMRERSHQAVGFGITAGGSPYSTANVAITLRRE